MNTRHGAEQYERHIREQLLAGTYGKEVKVVPTLEQFQERFLAYSDVNNKPSTAYAKRWVLREHLLPAFGKCRLDEIRAADFELYEERKLKEGQSPESVNNHLTVLRKILNRAVDWEELRHAPRLRALRVSHAAFEFLTFARGAVPRHPPRLRAFVTTAMRTGLRVGELLALEWEGLDLVAGRLVVRRTLWRDHEGTEGRTLVRGPALRRDGRGPEGAPAP